MSGRALAVTVLVPVQLAVTVPVHLADHALALHGRPDLARIYPHRHQHGVELIHRDEPVFVVVEHLERPDELGQFLLTVFPILDRHDGAAELPDHLHADAPVSDGIDTRNQGCQLVTGTGMPSIRRQFSSSSRVMRVSSLQLNNLNASSTFPEDIMLIIGDAGRVDGDGNGKEANSAAVTTLLATVALGHFR
ncbi:hypothetical protein VPH35_038163 [Triticum aestivum]|uniref:Uncharacterized protein n=1 Tax=Aegilops tauschii TaxID=37682 RepID=M8BT90_AEGTA